MILKSMIGFLALLFSMEHVYSYICRVQVLLVVFLLSPSISSSFPTNLRFLLFFFPVIFMYSTLEK